MTEFKVGDKVWVKDEVLFKSGGRESFVQENRGQVKKISSLSEEIGEVDYYLEGGGCVLGKHLIPFQEFKEGDWVVLKDEPLTWLMEDYVLPTRETDEFRGKRVEIDIVYGDGDYGLFNGHRGTTVNGKHIEREKTYEFGLDKESKNVLSFIYFKDNDLENTIDATSDDEAKSDPINPIHYNKYLYEPIEVIGDWGLSYPLGNVIKYIARHRDKGKPKEDLQKALWYLERAIDAIDN